MPRLAVAVVALTIALGAAPRAARAQRSHTVRGGQSLALIARRNGVSIADLAAANRMRPDETLRPGQVLDVPARGEVYVQAGQTLSHVARAHRCGVEELVRLNRLRPGAPLRVGQRLILPGHEALTTVTREDWGTSEVPGVVAIRTREGTEVVALRDEEGRVLERGLAQLGQLMWRADDEGARERRPDPRLALLLAAISDHFGGRPLTIVSGFREVGGFTRETSRHVEGRAVDVQVLGVPRRAVWDFCRSLAETGCGLYPRSVFVHVDVREGVAQWVDWSGPGQRARYGNLRGPFPRRRGARAPVERLGREVTRADLVPGRVEVVGPGWRSGFDVAPGG